MKTGLPLSRLLLRELLWAKINSFFCLLTVAIATATLVAMLAVGRASVDATRVMMKSMGFNLLITPEEVDPARYQILDFQDADMPEDYVQRLITAGKSSFPAEHLVGKYQKKMELNGETAVVTGAMAEVCHPGAAKKPMPTAYEVQAGEIYAGAAIASRLGLSAGDTFNLLGKDFKVARVLEAVGAMPEDIRIYADLHEFQELIGQPGRINAIDALSCHCDVLLSDLMGFLEKRIHEVLPDVQVTTYDSIFLARHRQRSMMHVLGLTTLMIVMATSAAALWGLTYQNVHNRRYEIGVLRALGVPASKIALLFLAKIMIYSILGAALGCIAGRYGATFLNLSGRAVMVPLNFYVAIIGLTPLVAMLFGLPPIVSRLLQEPVDVLGDRGA